MMRTIEILMVAVILFASFAITSYFAILPSPRDVSGLNLRELALSTIETLDANDDLARTVFRNPSDPSWVSLNSALAASLPANIVYNFTVYNIVTSAGGVVTYNLTKSFTNSEGDLGVDSDSSSYVVESSDVKFATTPQKIGENCGKNITLYILNCNDANGWWITGYTAQSLAYDLHDLLSPYFHTTILVNTTSQLSSLLDGAALGGERLQDAVVINTFGEAVPIPAGSYTTDGYDSGAGSYAKYAWILGQRVNNHNWTWVSIVGYPFYYVTNTVTFSNTQNTWGLYGMRQVGSAGLNSFLRGLNLQSYSYDNQWITGSPGLVQFSWNASYYSNYYGIYPSSYQTSTRALPTSILNQYNLHVPPNSYIFRVVGGWIAGATFTHRSGNSIQGSFTAIGLTRTPDIRITALGLLQHYHPSIYKSELGASGTSRLVVLQLAAQGGA